MRYSLRDNTSRHDIVRVQNTLPKAEISGEILGCEALALALHSFNLPVVQSFATLFSNLLLCLLARLDEKLVHIAS
jgi:hypothetical protein